MAVNSRGEIFAADPGNGRLHKFGPLPEAPFLTELRVPDWQALPTFWPQLTIDAQDRLFVSDPVGQKIRVYDSALKYQGTLAVQGLPAFAAQGMAFAPNGDLWVADMNASKLLRLRLGAKP